MFALLIQDNTTATWQNKKYATAADLYFGVAETKKIHLIYNYKVVLDYVFIQISKIICQDITHTREELECKTYEHIHKRAKRLSFIANCNLLFHNSYK
jgi:hypothetical protein